MYGVDLVMEKDTDKGKRRNFGKNHGGAGSAKQAPLYGYGMQEEEPPDYDFVVSRKKVESDRKQKDQKQSDWLAQLNKRLDGKAAKPKPSGYHKPAAAAPRPHKARRGRRVRKGPVAVLAVVLVALALAVVNIGRGLGPNEAENFAEKYAGLQPLNLPTYGERFWKENLYIGKNVMAGDDSLIVMPREEYEA